MNIPYAAARRDCTAAEFQLLESARAAQIAAMSVPALKAKVKRARTTLGKWRDLSKGQARRKGATPERTEAKTQWFEEAVTRFETELRKREARAAAAAKKAAKVRPAKKPTPARPKVGPKSGPAPAREKSVETAAKVRALRLAKSGILRQRGHALASGRRNQSKRNSR